MHINMVGAREIVGDRILRDSRWHHLALTADGRNLFLYIDGALDGNSPFMSATAEAPLVLGNLKSTDTFQGALDEFAFFNYPLSTDSVMRQVLMGSVDLKFLIRSSSDASFANTSWRGPNGNYLAHEEATAYTIGLWHLDREKSQAEFSGRRWRARRRGWIGPAFEKR